MKQKPIIISANLLAAVARWADVDNSRPTGVVAFRDDKIIATDGHRLIIVPHETHGQSFGVARAHLLAAVAAQDALASEDCCCNREIAIVPDGSVVAIDVGSVKLNVASHNLNDYPNMEVIEKATNGDRYGSPDGYLLDARYLAAIEEVNNMTAGYSCGVRVVQWSSIDANGKRGAVLLEGGSGVRFAIMPKVDRP